MHYMIVPGLRKLVYVESRSGENGCLMVSHAKDRRLQAMATQAGCENPLELLKAIWMKRFGLERSSERTVKIRDLGLTPDEKARFEAVAASHGRTPGQHLKAIALRKEGGAA